MPPRTGSTADGAVVRAAWLSLDRQGLADIAFAGEAAPWSTSHPLLAYGQGPDELPGYQRDVEAAARLLTDAGYEHGISLELPYPEQDQYPDGFFAVLVAAWAEAGITVEPVPLDRVTWLARLVTADYDLTVTRHGWYANPYRYLLPRPGWQAPPEEVLPELIPALTDLATASDEDRPDAFRRVQLLEAEHGYPFTGVVYVNSHHVYRTDLIEKTETQTRPARRRETGGISTSPWWRPDSRHFPRSSRCARDGIDPCENGARGARYRGSCYSDPATVPAPATEAHDLPRAFSAPNQCPFGIGE